MGEVKERVGLKVGEVKARVELGVGLGIREDPTPFLLGIY